MNAATLMRRVGTQAHHVATYLLRLCKQRIVRIQRAYYIYVTAAAVRYVKGVLC